ncbi:hypothetical protein [Streptacidiphilus monticola]|jgi:hypothetical protein|uniref:Uncharacterized protein n=1 Tax=Streptacidiphilus monticola TaxID=2161674 RepID=A0ABW1FUU1_9ACTN
MEVPSKLAEWVLDLLLQLNPGLDATAVLVALLALAFRGESRSFGRLVLAIGLVLFVTGHLALRITLPGSRTS